MDDPRRKDGRLGDISLRPSIVDEHGHIVGAQGTSRSRAAEQERRDFRKGQALAIATGRATERNSLASLGY